MPPSVHTLYRRISPLFRRRRMARFLTTLGPRPTERLLDLGGTADFWTQAGSPLPAQITLLNQHAAVGALAPGMTLLTGDACALPFADGAFDVIFSNSVIEHVGTWARQQAFAREARRVGRRLWVQTPARSFFLEPHLLAPFLHWLPRAWQRRLIRRFTLRGWLDRPDPAAIEAFLAEVRLLTLAEMRILFPDCTIVRERFLGLTKSYIAVRRLS